MIRISSFATKSRLGLALLLWTLASGVRAQSVDYGELESIFHEPVTTSVTGKPQRASDAPANLEIITRDDIRRSGATTIPEVLRFVTGVDVRENGIAGADVGIRGYNQAFNPHLMVLIDGRQVYMVDYGRIMWASLPVQLDEIRQIEVIKGPNSALYGFNAVGGVINIITVDPLHDRLNAATLQGGTQSDLRLSVVGTARIGDTAGLRLSAGGFTARDFAPDGLTSYDTATARPPRAGAFDADGRWQITPTVEAFASGSYGDSRVHETVINGQYFTEQALANSFRIGVNAETPAGLISASAYRNDIHYGGFGQEAPSGPPFAERLHEVVSVAQLSDLVQLGLAHTVRLALEYRDNAVSGPVLAGSASDTIVAESVMWDWQITPTVSFTNAVRLDHAELHFSGSPSPFGPLTTASLNATRITEPSLNSGAVWRATDQDTFRMSIARGVQFPSLVSQAFEFNTGAFSPFAYYGTPTVQPSITWNGEWDYDRDWSSIHSVLRAAAFVQRTDNVIAGPLNVPPTVVPPSALLFRAANVGNTTAAGLELAIKGHNRAGWRWNASYALAVTTDHTNLDLTSDAASPTRYSRSTPAHVVILGVGYSNGPWEADAMARWQSSYVDYRTDPAPPFVALVNVDNYVTMNARVGYRVNDNLTVALAAQQFNAPRLVTTAGAPTERQVIATVRAEF